MKSFDISEAKFVNGDTLAPEIRVVGNCDHVECRDSVSGNTVQIQQGDDVILIAVEQIEAVRRAILQAYSF